MLGYCCLGSPHSVLSPWPSNVAIQNRGAGWGRGNTFWWEKHHDWQTSKISHHQISCTKEEQRVNAPEIPVQSTPEQSQHFPPQPTSPIFICNQTLITKPGLAKLCTFQAFPGSTQIANFSVYHQRVAFPKILESCL